MEKTKDSRRWLLLLLMFAAFAVTFMTRFVWSPLNTTVTEELGLSNVAAGSFYVGIFYRLRYKHRFQGNTGRPFWGQVCSVWQVCL